jgi:hypothetical protein
MSYKIPRKPTPITIKLPDDKFAWIDGKCNSCGHDVFEMGSTDFSCDYMNWCSNTDCEHNVEHHIGDQEVLDYYTHK